MICLSLSLGLRSHLLYWRLFFSVSQGENPIYKSAVTTVVNPKYEGKWWSPAFIVTTLYGKELGLMGREGRVL